MITTDFDHTLMFEDGTPNLSTIEQLRDKKFIVITTRRNTSENQVEIIKFLNEHNLQWKSINFVKDEKEKLKLALRFNSDLHFEDSEEAIDLFNQANINCFNLEKWNLWLESL